MFPVLQGKQKLAVCESAIDAISYVQLHPGSSAIATGGTGKWQAALPFLEKHAHEYDQVVCASDNGEGGIGMAKALSLPHEPPPKGFGDWNDAAQAVAENPAISELWQSEVRSQIENPKQQQKARPRLDLDDGLSLG